MIRSRPSMATRAGVPTLALSLLLWAAPGARALQSTQPARGGEEAATAETSLLDGEFETTASGLRYRDEATGEGPAMEEGATATVHYTGWLVDGTKFDSSHDRGRPIVVREVGRARVIQGWNEGLLGMKAGGKRRLVIPAELGYGERGAGAKIPGGATLVFDVEVVSFTPEPPPRQMPDVGTMALVTNPSGLRWADAQAGSGAEVVPGSTAVVHYTGWLLDSGEKFDSSHDRMSPFPVANVGQARVIAGWNEGLVGMLAGGRRILVIPPDMAYGERGFPPVIPPGATLVFEVEVLEVR